MNTTHNRFRGNNSTADSQEPRYDHRGGTSLGFYHDTPSTGDSRPHIGVLDTAFDNELASANSHTSGSQSPSEYRNLGESPLTNKPNTAEVKIKKFPKFKFSLTAPPPKPKPKQPGQGRRAVHVGGRGGAGNIKRMKSATALSSEESNAQEKASALVSVENSSAPQPLPEGEPTSPEYGSPGVSPASRETVASRLKSGRGGAGNLYYHVLEDGVSEQAIAHEDAWIRKRREMQAEPVARQAGREGVINIKRSDDDTDLEYSTSPQSGSSGPRDFGGRGRGTGNISTKSSGTTFSTGVGSDMQTSVPDLPAYPSFRQRALLSGETPGIHTPVLRQEDADVLVARGYNAHLGRVGSARKTNGVHAIPPRAPTSYIRSGEPPGRARPGVTPLPRLLIPQDPPLDSHHSGGDGRRRLLVENPDAVARSRPQDISTFNGNPDHEPDTYFSSHGGSGNSPLSSQGQSPQRPIRAPPPFSPQRGFERRVPYQSGVTDSPEDRAMRIRTAHSSYQTTLTSPTIVCPPTPSTVFEGKSPVGFPGGVKGSRLYVTNESYLESDPKKLDIEPVRNSGADKDRNPDPGVLGKLQEEGRETPYSDFFEGRGATSLDLDSINSRREGTPFSDRSSILVPRGAPSVAQSSIARKTQNRPTNIQPADLPLILLRRPSSRPRSQSQEEFLHRDELDVPPHKMLSRMEKAILRRIEFGQNIDLSKIQLS